MIKVLCRHKLQIAIDGRLMSQWRIVGYDKTLLELKTKHSSAYYTVNDGIIRFTYNSGQYVEYKLC